MPLTLVELIYGPIFLGVTINTLLYGIMITQTYIYYSTYKKDKMWMKLLVGLLFVADTLNTVFDVAFLYQRLVVHYNDPDVLGYADWIFNTDPAMTCIIAFLVQTFFAWRVKVVTSSTPALIVIAFCAVAQLLGGLATAIACGIVTQFVEFQKFQVVVIIWLVFSALADCIIAAALVGHLQTHKTGFAATDSLITKLTRLTVSTGAITAVCAIIDLIAFLGSTSGLHLAFNMPLAKLYTNSLLSSLNARQAAKRVVNTDQAMTSSGVTRGISARSGTATEVLGSRREEIVNFDAKRPGVFVSESHEMVDVTENKEGMV